MRIRYKKIIRSTNVGPSTLIKNIKAELDKPGYKIIIQTQSCVEFAYNTWRVGSRAEVISTVDGRTFDLAPEGKTIVFTFYISPVFEILATSIAAIFGIFQDYHIFIFVIFIAVMFIIRIIAVKNVANRMIENILNNDLS